MVTEVCQLIEKRQGSNAEAAFLNSFGSGLTLVDLTSEDLIRIVPLIESCGFANTKRSAEANSSGLSLVGLLGGISVVTWSACARFAGRVLGPAPLGL
ncbi:hypothetical protein [Planotetraspora sp. GP83]|uniref:hypothetical protein n=1 Tax=Planotetraspora sp. GP83 TaxID=3156264 RepID=UPI003516821C